MMKSGYNDVKNWRKISDYVGETPEAILDWKNKDIW